jgi:hypothetical protein
MQHLDEGTLNALLDGELPRAEVEAFQLHLSGCGDCRERLAEARRLRDEAMELVGVLDRPPAATRAPSSSGPVAPESRSGGAGGRWAGRGSWTTGLAWAASLVLALTGGYLLGGAGRRTATPAGSDAPAAEERVLAAAPPATPPAATERLDAIPAQPPPSLSPAEPSRSAVAPTGEPAEVGPASAVRRVDSAGPGRGVQAPANDLTPPPAREQEAARERAAPQAPAAMKDELDKFAARPTAFARFDARQASARQLRDSAAVEGGAAGTEAAPGGVVRLRLVGGLVVDRIEQVDSLIRVHYATPFGRLVLEQWRAGSEIRTRLVAPPGAPADSLAAWRERVR